MTPILLHERIYQNNNYIMKRKILVCCFLLLSVTISCTIKDQKNDDSHSEHVHATTEANGERYVAGINNGTIKIDTLKGSPQRTAMGFVGDCYIHIIYNSPGTKGRVIWGGLVPMDQVWVTGAHAATRINFSADVKIDGKKINKGEYAFFTIPGKKTWTLILNTRFQQHLTDDYRQAEDVIRFQVSPEQLSNPVQRLTYKVQESSATEGTVSVEWDTLKITFPIAAIGEIQ